MWLLYKRPVSLLQGYRDFSKLLCKETIASREASVMTRVAPFLVLAPLLIVLFYLPPAVKGGYCVSFVDAFTITGLLALSTFFLMLLGLDGASSFGGMGSSREAFISALVEPAMVLTIFSVSMMAGDLGVGQAGVNLAQHFPQEHMASCLFAAISFFILLIAENGRIPVDNPETHLELTMVHEAMILDITGVYLAIRMVDSGSCNAREAECNALSNPYYDLERLGIHFVASPRHADMMLLSGVLTFDMLPHVLDAWEQIPEPKWCITLGDCPVMQAPFERSFAITVSASEHLPVAYHIPGCPRARSGLSKGFWAFWGILKPDRDNDLLIPSSVPLCYTETTFATQR
jgi:Ni,Fe-hydrogenase III small subunit